MRILFYYSSNKRTIPIDVPLQELQRRGHKILLLTTCEKGNLHDIYRRQGAETHSFVVTKKNVIQWHIAHIKYLVQFCKSHQVDVIHSHLQQTNLIATLAHHFLKARVIVFRHHGKFEHLVPGSVLKPHTNEIRADWLINKLAKWIAVPSEGVKQLMIIKEQVDCRKIRIVPYVYDFDRMTKINHLTVQEIRSRYPAKLLLIMVSRMTPYKRHLLVLPTIKKLIRDGLDIRMLIMDEGPNETAIKDYIVQNQLQDRIFLAGFKSNILEYIAAADILVHPSLTEASNSAVKEAGLLQKAVLVCQGVGDFDDYIRHGENGYMLNPANFAQEAKSIIRRLYDHPEEIGQAGEALASSVRQRFSVRQEVIDQYESL